MKNVYGPFLFLLVYLVSGVVQAATLSAPTATTVTFTVSKSDVNCNGEANGSIVITASGGISPYQYSKDNGATYQTTNQFVNQPAGTYQVVVKDAGNIKTAAQTVVISQPTAISYTTAIKNVSCFGGSDGSVVVDASGGQGPYTYHLSDMLASSIPDRPITSSRAKQAAGARAAVTSKEFTNLQAKPYYLSITDAAGCGQYGTITIRQPTALSFSTTATNVRCAGGSTGSITVSASGGTSPYQYSSDNGNTFQSSNQLTGLTAGTYQVVVKDANDCLTAEQDVTLTQPTAVTFTTTKQNASPCYGSATGSLTVSASGGTGAFQYSKDNGATFQTGNTFTNLAANTYPIVVRDANGCLTTAQPVTITQPAALTFSITKTNVNTCYNDATGSITVTASGGTAPYQYSKDNGATFQTSNQFAGLPAGTYQVVTKDANGCLAAAQTVTISQPTQLGISTTKTDITCNGSSNGTLTIAASGGTAPYQYSKDNGTTYQSGNQFANLAAGRYPILVRDANGCLGEAPTVTISQPIAVSFTSAKTDATCYGSATGSLTVSASGGTGTYQYSKDNGATFQASNKFTNLTAGSYQVIVKDANGCVTTAQSITIGQPAAITVSTSQTNVSCNGYSNGTISVTASGGSGSYQYSNDNGSYYQTNTQFEYQLSGTYQIVVKDGSGCISPAKTVVLSQPTTISYVATSTNVSCYGGADGSITVTASGGTAPYQYQLTDAVSASIPTPGTSARSRAVAATNGQFTGLSPKLYHVLIQDANGCSKVVDITINQPAALSVTTAITNAQCLNTTTGHIVVNVSGGTGTYQYSKDNGTSFQASNTFANLAAGTYQIVVKDANNCLSSPQAAVVSQPTAVTFTTTKSDIACFGGSTGTITVTAGGGTASYQYSKDNGATFQTGNTFTNLAANTYSIVVRDANGCLATAQTVTINQTGAITPVASKTDVTTCYGASTGAIAASATGGTGPYQYSKDNGATFQTGTQFNNLPAATYLVVVKDANGCVSTAQSISINQPVAVAFTTTKTDVVCAAGNTGSISVSALGGMGAYQYSKDNGATFQMGNAFIGLSAGTYQVVVKDANGCTATAQLVTINQPAALSFTATKVDVACAGANSGQVTVSASGGTVAYQYSKDNGATFQTSNQFTNLTVGTYRIIVKDANGCTTTAQSITINQPTTLASTTTPTNVTGCYGASTGSLTVSATGGTGPYQYSINNGNSFQASNAFTSLTAGTYQIVVKDANGCTTAAQPVTITQPAALANTVAKTDVNTCFGGNTGSITVNTTGGTGVYQYSKDNGTTFQAGNSFTGLTAGVYTIVVKDAVGCATTAQTVTINQPALVTATVSTLAPTCYGQTNGTISVTASGGTGLYQYSKDNGLTFQTSNQFVVGAGDYRLIVKDANGCLSSPATVTVRQPTPLQLMVMGQTNPTCFGATSGSISVSATGGSGNIGFTVNNGNRTGSNGLYTAQNLAAGVYILAAVDDNGCNSPTQSVTITQPAAVSFVATRTNVTTCYGASTGSITLSASGGTGTYGYSKDNGATFQATNSFANLPAGTYPIVVKDANGCVAPIQSITITQPIQLTFSTTKTDIGCAGSTTGSVSVSAAGGTAPYQFSKDNGTTYQTSSTFTGLAVGIYTVVVKDANSCVAPAQSLTINQAAPLAFSVSQTNAACYGTSTGSLAVSASGGTAPYQYSSDNGRTFQSSAQLTSLAAGTYGVQVKDANGCLATTQSFTISQPTTLSLTASQTNSVCFGANTGTINLTATGGTGNYQYSRDNGTTFQNAGQFTGLSAGVYPVISKDANGCLSSGQSITLTQPAQLTFITTITNVSCAGASTGRINVVTQGGTAPYQYSRDNGATFQMAAAFTDLPGGIYTLVVRDANGCVTPSQSISVSQPAPLSETTSLTNVACFGTSTGSLVVSTTGGTAPYQYAKDNGVTFQANSTFSSLAVGTYAVVVRDANGCTTPAQSVTISQPATALSFTSAKTDATCTVAGSISVSASGGTMPYQYSKDNGTTYQSDNSFTSLSAGTYAVVVKDANGCITSVQSITISQPTTLSVTTTQTNATCFGANTGSLTANATGGVSAYQYSKDNGATYQISNNFTGLAAGTYAVVVKDGSSCLTPAQSVTLTQPAQVTFITNQTNVICAGGNTGTISISATGGTTPYQYSKDDGVTFQPTNSFSNLPAGNYVVLIRDANGCVTSAQSVSLTQPAGLTVTATQVNPVCFGGNGSVNVSASGGTAPYQYSLDNGQTYQSASTFTNLMAKAYSLVVRDANGCTTAVQSVTLTQPAALAVAVSQTNVTSCSASSNGIIIVTASGGTAPYQYAIDNGTTFQTANQFTGLASGTYAVVVRDANGCQTTPRSVTLTQPNALNVLVAKTDVSTAGGSNGTMSVTATGGTSPYQYSRDNGTTYQTSASFTGLPANVYIVTVRDGNGCVSQAQSVTVSQPTTITALTNKTDVACYGATTGSISITASGGTAPYQYSKDNGVTYQTSATFTGLGAGNYTILIRDAGAITSAAQAVVISQPTQLTFITTATSVSCFNGNNGQIIVTASGGTGAYQYSKDNGLTFQTSTQFAGLATGTYAIVVKDGTGCSSLPQSVSIGQPAMISLGTSQTNVACFGTSTGSISLTASGGTTPYQYSYDNGATYGSTARFSGLVAGVYQVVVNDANGCTSATQSISLTQPNTGLSILVQGTNPTSCSGGNGVISLTATGGTTPYQYSYDNGATFQNNSRVSTLNGGMYRVSVKDANGCLSSVQSVTLTQPSAVSITVNQVNNTACTSALGNGSITLTASGGTAPYQYSKDNGVTYQAGNQFVNLSAGQYQVIIKDAGGCLSPTQSVSISQPSPVSVAVAKTDVSCFGASTGSLTLTALGGIAPYHYSRDNGATFQTNNQITGVAAGTYTIVAQDANGCLTNSQSVTVGQPAPLTLVASATNVSCFGAATGVITVTATGGTTPYQYSFDTVAGFQSSNSRSGLVAGIYSVLVRDANGCATAVQSVTLNQPTQLQAVTSTINPTCNTTGSISLTASGGTAPYQYSRDNGTTYQASNQFAGLSADAYSVIVRDANGCLSTTQSVTLTQPVPLSLTLAKTDVTCSGASTGNISVTATGGASPYQYSKDNGAAYQTTGSFTNLSAGAYLVVVKDANGCVSMGQSITLTQPTPLTITATQTNLACFGGSTGTISVSASGGSAGYQYSRDNGTTFQTINAFVGLPAGIYTIVVKDGSGCVSPAQAVTISQPTALSLTIAQTSATCSPTGTISVSATGGTAPYQFSADNGKTFQASNTFSGLPSGLYTVVGKDANGCVTPGQSVSISQVATISFTTNQTNVVCAGGTTGSISVSAAGGTVPYQYSRNNGATFQTGATFAGLSADIYSIVVRDANGCLTAAQSVSLTQPAPLSLTATKIDITCANNSTGTISVSITGGTGPYQYSFDNGTTYQLSNSFTNVLAGSYSIIGRDANGCTTNIQSVSISQPVAISVTASQTNVACAGGNTGSITLNAAGGMAPYQYSRDGGVTYQPGATFASLSAGRYSVVVNDANGCLSPVQSIGLSQPTALSVTAIPTSVACFGGNTGVITVTASGGTAPYRYSRDNGTTFQSTNAFTGLTAGTYTVVVNDASGCQLPAQAVVVSQPAALTATVNLVNVTSCNAANSNGSITVTATGGTVPYRYSIDKGANVQTGNQFANLAAGTYSVLVTDAVGCAITTPVATLTQPAALSVAIAKTDVTTCFGTSSGSLTLTASGGTTPYQYSINNGSSFQTGNQFTSLAAGTFGVVVRDANGCLSTVQSVTINQPTVLQLTTSQNNNICFSGTSASITINATGGTAPYRYSVDNGLRFGSSSAITNLAAGVYTVLVQDANGCTTSAQSVSISQPAALTVTIPTPTVICAGTNTGRLTVNVAGGTAPYQYSIDNGATFNTSSGLTGLAAGNYAVVVKDAAGCLSVAQSISIRSAPAVQVTTVITDVRCYGANTGAIVVNATGGVRPYRYSIDNGATFQTGNQFNNLPANTYTILVSDSLTCAASSQSGIVKQPVPLIATLTQTNSNCNGANTGSITISATGGTSPYRYSLDNGTTYQPTGQFANLAAGNYSVRVVDANGCTSASQSVSLTQPVALSVATTQTNPSCNGSSTGSIRVTVSGGVTPYTYSSDNGATFQTTASFNGLKAGAYSIVIRDANGCATSAQPVSLTQPAILDLTVRSVDALCSTTSVNTGSVTATVTGGTGPYQYSRDNGATFQASPIFTGLSAGSYSLLVKDANGCQAPTQTVILRSSQAPTVRLSASQLRCDGDQNATVTAQVTGGTAPYVYSWNGTVQSTTTLTGVGAGLYTLRVTDNTNCQATDTIRINRPLPLVTPTLVASQTICRGDTALFTASNPQATVQWQLNGAVVASTNQFSATQGGTYAAIITNPTGCQVSATTQLTLTAVRPESSILLSSQAKVGEVVELIDLTQPVPDSVRWVLSTGATLVSSPSGTPTSRFVQYITFAKTGLYTIRSEVKALQVCTTRASNSIRIVSANQATFYDSTFANQPISYDPDTFIEDVTVSPNPNQGNFSVKVTLKGVGSLRVRLLDDKIGEFTAKDAQGDKSYDIPFSITPPAAPTFYYINVQTRYGVNNSILVQKTIRVLVTN